MAHTWTRFQTFRSCANDVTVERMQNSLSAQHMVHHIVRYTCVACYGPYNNMLCYERHCVERPLTSDILLFSILVPSARFAHSLCPLCTLGEVFSPALRLVWTGQGCCICPCSARSSRPTALCCFASCTERHTLRNSITVHAKSGAITPMAMARSEVTFYF